jgi:hypothetical protein
MEEALSSTFLQLFLGMPPDKSIFSTGKNCCVLQKLLEEKLKIKRLQLFFKYFWVCHSFMSSCMGRHIGSWNWQIFLDI